MNPYLMHVHVSGKALTRRHTYKCHFHIGTIILSELYTFKLSKKNFWHITMVSIPGHVPQYCKFGNFRKNYIFANSVKRHIWEVKNSRPVHDLPIPVNDRMIRTYCKSFIFTKLFRENKILAKISKFTVVNQCLLYTYFCEYVTDKCPFRIRT